jgi:hypothetical protein
MRLSSITDGDNIRSKAAKAEFNRALHLFPAKKSGWIPTTATCSAITLDGTRRLGHDCKICRTDERQRLF